VTPLSVDLTHARALRSPIGAWSLDTLERVDPPDTEEPPPPRFVEEEP
jgi:hypothetical protein